MFIFLHRKNVIDDSLAFDSDIPAKPKPMFKVLKAELPSSTMINLKINC